MSATIKKEMGAGKVYDNWIKQVTANSRASYGRVIPQFLEMALKTDTDSVTGDMLESLTPTDVYERYVSKLRFLGFKDSTISNYISIVRSYVGELESNRIFPDIDYKYLKETALSTKRLKNDRVGRSDMSMDDYESFGEWLIDRGWSKRYRNKGVQYALVLKFMFTTAIRINSTFNNIRWVDIKRNFDNHGNFGYVIHALDKGGKINNKPITEDFYNELRENLFAGDEESLVFGDLSKQNFTRLMNEFSKETGREITPHSIKVGAGTRLYSMTKDLLKVQKFLDHTDPKVTLRYIRNNNDITESGSYILSSDITIDEIDEISYDDLVRIIKSKPELAYTVIGEAKKGGLV